MEVETGLDHVDSAVRELAHMELSSLSPVAASGAATKVQKVYRSYRTRRKLADSAVVVEGLWWQALDFARLNHSTISFYDDPQPETAASRWNRVSLNASKVGQGLSRDGKALKLAVQHWIEAQEREYYEYIITEGKIVHKMSGEPLDTSQGPKGTKWIFVMSTAKKLYSGKKERGVFQHSSFLAGGAAIAAGTFIAENGVIKSIWAHSGHYKPSAENLSNFMSFLEENGVDLKEVEVRSFTKEDYYEDPVPNTKQNSAAAIMSSNPPKLILPSNRASGPSSQTEADDDNNVRAEQARETYQRTLSGGLQSPRDAGVSQEAILERVNSKSKSKSYQLGHGLSLQWSTGNGPRIACVKDYPMELRTQALEMVQQSTPPPKGIDSSDLVEGTGMPLSNLANIAARASDDLPAPSKLRT